MRTPIVATLLLAILMPPAAMAACDIGTIARIAGDVQLERRQVASAPATGGTLCTGDRFVTGQRGVAELHFRDGTQIIVGRESNFSVDRWQERRLVRNEAVFTLAKGAFRAVTGTITRRSHRFEVNTPLATIGIRGTDFWGGLSMTPDALEVVMLEGKGVYVRNASGRTELQEAGSGTTVTAGNAPTAPASWPAEKVQRAVQTITP